MPLQAFPNPLPLMQGRLHTAGRFEYASAQDGTCTTHLAIFGQSFIVLAFVTPDRPQLYFADSGASGVPTEMLPDSGTFSLRP